MDSNSSFNLSFIKFPGNGLLGKEFVYYFNIICIAFTEAFSLFGCFSNIVNMIVFARQGFTDSINVSLFAISMSDFGACFTLIWENIGFHPNVSELDHLPFHPDEVVYLLFTWPHVYFIKITTIITSLIVFERCLCVVMPIRIKSIITTRRVKMFVISTVLCVMASFVPIYYANRLDWKFNPDRNRSVLGVVFTSNRQEIESALFLLHSFVLSVFPFIFISVCTAILYINLRKKAVWRQSATAVTAATQTNEILNKDIRVAKMVVQVSTLFIVCLFPFAVYIVVMAVDKEVSVTGKKYNLYLTLGSFALVPESMSSALNIFVYYRNSSKYQSTFSKLFHTKQ